MREETNKNSALIEAEKKIELLKLSPTPELLSQLMTATKVYEKNIHHLPSKFCANVNREIIRILFGDVEF